ncbi:MFS transporter [Sulfobacillus sp. hq2]|uniref:MFS transporter n=1 Tax=Sulfobacillus thermotolerans TaxID=338644 RepID=A0ABN5GWY8_9FIRM|nr:MFS transporter [Sulfobacillus sp. hq2]AUW92870.1 MFS transporter [Sulfobacillus thermotolerans]MCY0909411.1 MFS transporter [Sulfobacillus thermotolerans]POB10019.1 MFS transporter [Sulfobacillus sp. hq2]
MSSAPSPYTRKGWHSLGTVAQRLIAARFLRSIAQGALAVDFTLYLKARGWSAVDVGLLLMAGGLSGAVLSLLVGIVSDRIGRRLFLLIYEIGLTVGMAAIIIHPAAWIIVVTAAIFGFGRGANGSSGPFAPAEQAWLAQSIPGPRRGSVFSFNAGLQFWGMGIGSLLAAVLPHMIPGARGAQAYLPLFLLNLLMALINLAQIYSIHESPRHNAHPSESASKTDGVPEEHAIHRRENRALTLLAIVNTINALGIGLVAPLLPYWFNVKFGVGPAEIGPVYGLTFFLTGISSLIIGRVSESIGLIRSIVIPRLLGVVLLIGIPFMPSFTIAAVLYVVRSIVNRGSVGARQAFSLSLVRDKRRGFASSLNAVSWSLPAAVGPAVGGWFINMGSLVWPFIIAAGLQLGYVILFPTIMAQYEVKSPASP